MPAKRTAHTPLRLAKLCRDIALDKKAEDVVILDLRKISSLTDFFVICSGTSDPHLKAIANEILNKLKELGLHRKHYAGTPASRWLVLDYADVLVHIFHPKSREFYALEDLWKDAKRIK